MPSLSFAAIAEEAGTTRPAIYRRWATKARARRVRDGLVSDRRASGAAQPNAAADPFGESASAELDDFRRGVSLPGRLSLVGTMLQSTTAPDAAARYRARIVAPRRARLRAILERAAQRARIDRDADLDVAVTMLDGVLVRALSGRRRRARGLAATHRRARLAGAPGGATGRARAMAAGARRSREGSQRRAARRRPPQRGHASLLLVETIGLCERGQRLAERPASVWMSARSTSRSA